MPRRYKTLDQRIGFLCEKKDGIGRQLAALNREIQTRRKFIVGGSAITHAAIDPEFRRKMHAALEKALAPRDREILSDLMEGMGTPPRRSLTGRGTRPVFDGAAPVTGVLMESARVDCAMVSFGAKIAGTGFEDHPGGPEPMPKTRRTLDEQLAALKQKREAIEKQLNAVETRKKETDRKLETRRKIIVGGALIAHAEIDPEFRSALQAALQKAVAPKDRALVADLIRSGIADAASGPVAGDKAAEKEPAPPVPARPTRPGPQPPGTRPPAPGQSG